MRGMRCCWSCRNQSCSAWLARTTDGSGDTIGNRSGFEASVCAFSTGFAGTAAGHRAHNATGCTSLLALPVVTARPMPMRSRHAGRP